MLYVEKYSYALLPQSHEKQNYVLLENKILLLSIIYLIHILLQIFFQNTLPPQPVAIIDIRLGVSLKICPFCRRLTSKRNGIRSQRYSIPSALILDPVSRKAPRLITVSIRHQRCHQVIYNCEVVWEYPVPHCQYSSITFVPTLCIMTRIPPAL